MGGGRFAVVICSPCRTPWAVETRHERVTCPRCGKSYLLKDRKRAWEGDDARQAQVAVGIVAEKEAKRRA